MTPTGIKTVSRIRKVVTGGTRRVLRIRKNTSSGLVEVFNDVPSLAATVSDATFFATANTTVQGIVNITASGGMAPYSYSTSVLSSSNPTSVLNQATASPTLRQTGVASETTGAASIRTVVTDSSGQSLPVDYFAEFTNVGAS